MSYSPQQLLFLFFSEMKFSAKIFDSENLKTRCNFESSIWFEQNSMFSLFVAMLCTLMMKFEVRITGCSFPNEFVTLCIRAGFASCSFISTNIDLHHSRAGPLASVDSGQLCSRNRVDHSARACLFSQGSVHGRVEPETAQLGGRNWTATTHDAWRQRQDAAGPAEVWRGCVCCRRAVLRREGKSRGIVSATRFFAAWPRLTYS